MSRSENRLPVTCFPVASSTGASLEGISMVSKTTAPHKRDLFHIASLPIRDSPSSSNA